MASKIGVLDYHQPATAQAVTFIKRPIADDLLSRLCAEQISQKLIRLFPPTSAFPSLKPSQIGGRDRYIPAEMPMIEAGGCIFQAPKSPLWREQHLQEQLGVARSARQAFPAWIAEQRAAFS